MGFGQIGRRRLRRDGYRKVSCEDARRSDTSFLFGTVSLTARARRSVRCVARRHSLQQSSATKDMVALTVAQKAAVVSFLSSKRGTRKLIEHPPEDWPAQSECETARSAQNLACRAPAHTVCSCIARVVT